MEEKGYGRTSLITATVFLAVFVTGMTLIYLDIQTHRIERKRVLTEVAAGVAQSIHSHLDHLLSATFALETTVRQGEGKIDHFPRLARDVIATYEGVSNIQLAPGGVVKKIYPLKGHEDAIGHDLLKDPERRDEALETIRSKKLTLAGPVTLIQGGVAVIGRLPVFLPDETGAKQFWGFTIVLIPFDELLKLAGMEKLPARGYDWVLWRDAPRGIRREVLARSTKDGLIKPVNFSFGVPNGTWNLSLSDQRRPVGFVTLGLNFLLVVVVSSVASLAVNRSLSEANRLKLQVSGRTKQLQVANESLEVDLIRRTRTTELSEAINRINVIAARQETNIEDALEQAMREACDSLGSEKAMIAFRDGDDWTINHIYGYPQTLSGRRLSTSQTPELNLAARENRPIFVTDTTKDGRVNTILMKERGIRSLLALPLAVTRGPIGIIGFYYHSRTTDFSDEEIAFANELMATLSVAIGTRRIHDTEHMILDTVQSALLSVPTTIPGLEIGHVYRSATDFAAIGGDFFDVFELETGVIGILVGDVSGHGVEAAGVAALVKNTVRAFSVQGRSPAQTLGEVNEVVFRTTGAHIFATAILGILDVRTGSFQYCNAGHPAMIVIDDGRVTELNPTSRVLGAVHEFSYVASKTELGPDAIGIMYTDGVIEARRGVEFFGEERLRSAAQGLSETGPKALPGKLLSRVEDFTSGHLTDDLVVLAFRRKPESERSRNDKNTV